MSDTDLMQPWLIAWIREREESLGQFLPAMKSKCAPSLGVHERCEHDLNWQESSFRAL